MRASRLDQLQPSILSKARGCVAAWHAGGGNGPYLTPDGKLRDFISETHHAAFLGGTNNPLALGQGVPTPFLYLPGIAANYASVPDAANLRIVGDIDIRAAVVLPDWTPAAAVRLVSRRESATNVSYGLLVNTNGTLGFLWSAILGTAASEILTGSSTAAPTVTDGALLLVRATLDVDNGAAGYDLKYWTKVSTPLAAFADLRLHTGWTQLGTTVVGVGTTSIFAGTSPVEIGSITAGTASLMTGNVYGAAIYDGIAGTEVFAATFTNLGAYNTARTSLTAVTDQTVTINGATTNARRTDVVDGPGLLFGTDDYLEVPSHSDLGPSLYNGFTALLVGHSLNASSTSFVWGKKDSSAAVAGWSCDVNGAGNMVTRIHDGTNAGSSASTSGWRLGADSVAGVRVIRRTTTMNRIVGPLATVGTILNASVVDISAVGDVSNSRPLRIGANSAASPGNFGGFVFRAAAIWQRDLSDIEILVAIREMRNPLVPY